MLKKYFGSQFYGYVHTYKLDKLQLHTTSLSWVAKSFDLTVEEPTTEMVESSTSLIFSLYVVARSEVFNKIRQQLPCNAI